MSRIILIFIYIKVRLQTLLKQVTFLRSTTLLLKMFFEIYPLVPMSHNYYNKLIYDFKPLYLKKKSASDLF